MNQAKYQHNLQSICDKSLSDVISLLQINTIIAIGKYAEKRSHEVIKNFKLNNVKVKIENISNETYYHRNKLLTSDNLGYNNSSSQSSQCGYYRKVEH